jgi:hypothetical protein
MEELLYLLRLSLIPRLLFFLSAPRCNLSFGTVQLTHCCHNNGITWSDRSECTEPTAGALVSSLFTVSRNCARNILRVISLKLGHAVA